MAGVDLAVVELILVEVAESCRQFVFPKLRYPPYLPKPYEKNPLASGLLLLLRFSTKFQWQCKLVYAVFKFT